MKDLKSLFKKTEVFVGVAIFLSVLAFFVVTYFLSLPRFQSYLKLRGDNVKLKSDTADIARGINTVSSLDAKELSLFSTVMDLFIPEKEDRLRFLTLSEGVAQGSSVALSSVELNVTEVGSVQPQQPTQTNPSAGAGQETGGQTNVPVPPQPVQAKSYTMGLTLSGSFSSILNFISNYQESDRLVAVKELSIDGTGTSLTAHLVFELPLSGSISQPDPKEDLKLTSEERDLVLTLLNKQYSASPAKNRLGRSDPFR